MGSSKIRLTLKSLPVLRFSFFSAVFGLLTGLILSFPFFILFRTLLDGFEIANISIFSIFLIVFLFFPLFLFVLNFVFGFLIGVLLKFSLRFAKGIKFDFEYPLSDEM